MPTKSFLIAPTELPLLLHSYRMLAYHDEPQVEVIIRNFGVQFEPRYIVGAGLLDQ